MGKIFEVLFVNHIKINLSVLILIFLIFLINIYLQKKTSDAVNKLLVIEKLSLEIKSFFVDFDLELAIFNTLTHLNKELKSEISIYALYDPLENSFYGINTSYKKEVLASNFLDDSKITDNEVFQEKVKFKKAFLLEKSKLFEIENTASTKGSIKIQAGLFIPIAVNDKQYFVVLFSKKKKFSFSKRELSAFDLVGEVIESGITRIELEQTETALLNSIINKNKELVYINTHSPNIVLTFDRDSRFVEVNQKAREILGIDANRLDQYYYEDFIHPDDVYFKNEVFAQPEAFENENEPIKVRLRLKTLKYGYRWYEWYVYVFKEEDEILKRISIGKDVTDELEHEKKLEYLLTHDPLTDLYNSVFVKERLKKVSDEDYVFCAYINISNFRQVNDVFGHLVGDEFLIQFGSRLRKRMAILNDVFVARVSGDEFVVLLISSDHMVEGAMMTIRQILTNINSSPIDCFGNLINFNLSVGFASYPNLSDDPRDVYRYAEVAMFESKKKKRSVFQDFNRSFYDKQLLAREIMTDAQNALLNDEFEMFYQPLFNTDSPDKIYVESLVRWRHPTKGLLSPGQFLDVLENNGQIIEVSRVMFEKVCKFIQERRNNGFNIESISFNLSVASLQLKDEALFFVDLMKKHEIEPYQIVIEITESLFFENDYSVNQNLKVFRANDVLITIDDFGMKYSTLSMLEKVHYDVIKLDKHFTKNLGEKNADLVVNMIVELCDYNHKRCIVEGVEEEWQLEELKTRGFSEFQGYYFSKPIPGNQLEEFYNKIQ
jgi:diguanylate cyclase (GGDEF)-like protein/PAS domain S-box-containing protein